MQKQRKNPHIPLIIDLVRDIRGVKVRQVLSEYVVVAAYQRQGSRLKFDDLFQGLCHHLKDQGVVLEKPSVSVVRESKRLAPAVRTIRAVSGKETPPTLSIGFRLANVGDIRYREQRTEAVIRQRLFGDTDDEHSVPHPLEKFAGQILIPSLSRLKFVQERMLHW